MEAPALDFEAFFAAAPGMLMVLGPEDDYPIVAVNDAYLARTRTRREDLIGRGLFDAFQVNPADPQSAGVAHWRASFARVRSTLQPDTLTRQRWDLALPGGGGFEERHWTIFNAPVLGPGGALRYIVRRLEDVTAEVVSDRELHDTRSRLEATLVAAEIGTWIWDVRADRVYADRNLARLFQVSAEDAAGGPIARYTRAIHPEDRERTKAEIERAIQQRSPLAVEYRVARAGGEVRWVAARGAAEYDAAGQVARFPGVVVDITARRLAETALRESEERARLAIESADLGTWDYSQSGELTWSDKCRAIFGLPEGVPVTHEAFLSCLHPDERERADASIRRARQPAGGGTFHEEYLCLGPSDGAERWIDSRGRATFNAEGQVTRFIGTVLDITANKHAEKAAERRTAQLQTLAAISTRLNAARDIQSVLGIMTEEARRLIGAREALSEITSDARGGRPVAVASRLEKEREETALDVTGFSPIAQEARAPVRLNRAELEARAGGPAPNGWMGVALIDRHTHPIGTVQLFDKEGGDFTADDAALLAQAAQIAASAIEGARLYQELREKDQRKDEFLAMLAHELRNPLAAMRNAVELADDGAPPEDLAWSREVIDRQLRRLTRLIDDLLDVSRITQGKIELRREFIDAASILRHAVDAVAPLVAERRHELSLAYRPGDLPIEADPARIEQILVNLLTNAAKYTESGGNIVLEARQEGGEIVISVRDNGMGIATEKLAGMFELFAQGDRTLARSEGGLGIGLTIVRALAEMHGGSVQAFSEGPGRGSQFVVRLPAARPPAAAGDAASGTNPVLGGMAATRAARILVVDDNADSAHGTARILRRLGHDVRMAYDGPSALVAARDHEAEFILLDIGLPGMDGYEVARRLREDAGLRDAIIIAVSGYGQPEDRRRSREAGFDQHLVKPVDLAALLASLALVKPG